MKIVAINGSPTGSEGNTGAGLQALIDAAKAAGAEVELLELGNLAVGPCISCHTCQRTGECVIDDDCELIQDALRTADGLVLGSPNYISNVSGQVKCLLDRCVSLFHTQALHGKYGAVVLATGGPGYETVEQYMTGTIRGMGCWCVGSLIVGGMQMQDPDLRRGVLAEAAALGRELAAAIEAKKRYPDQEDERTRMFETFHWLVQQRKEDWPYEYEYWQKHWPE